MVEDRQPRRQPDDLDLAIAVEIGDRRPRRAPGDLGRPAEGIRLPEELTGPIEGHERAGGVAPEDAPRAAALRGRHVLHADDLRRAIPVEVADRELPGVGEARVRDREALGPGVAGDHAEDARARRAGVGQRFQCCALAGPSR